MYIEAYDYLVENGVDDYAWDADAEAVEEEADSVNEVRVFPWKESGNGDGDAGEEPTDGAGNFGIIDFGGGNASVVQEQITNGIAPADMVDAIGTSDPVYFDEDGNPVTYDIPGQPGMMSSIESALASRIGDVIAFFVHDQVADPGSNAVYHNVGIRYGRLMAVQLTGNPNTRKVAVQPVAYQGSAVSVSESAPSTSGQLGRITLVR
jgi:hypothetical protein